MKRGLARNAYIVVPSDVPPSSSVTLRFQDVSRTSLDRQILVLRILVPVLVRTTMLSRTLVKKSGSKHATHIWNWILTSDTLAPAQISADKVVHCRPFLTPGRPLRSTRIMILLWPTPGTLQSIIPNLAAFVLLLCLHLRLQRPMCSLLYRARIPSH